MNFCFVLQICYVLMKLRVIHVSRATRKVEFSGIGLLYVVIADISVASYQNANWNNSDTVP